MVVWTAGPGLEGPPRDVSDSEPDDLFDDDEESGSDSGDCGESWDGEPDPMDLPIAELARRFSISEEDAEHIRTNFVAHDSDSSGSIDVDELSTVLAAMGFELPHDKMREAIQEIDHNSSGSLDLLEFMEMIVRCGASLSPCMFMFVYATRMRFSWMRGCADTCKQDPWPCRCRCRSLRGGSTCP